MNLSNLAEGGGSTIGPSTGAFVTPLTFGDLEYEGLVGEGAFAKVKRYRVRANGAKVAVKTLVASDQDSHLRFLREVELLRSLQPHENIVELLGQDDDSGRPAYFMPLAESNLHDYVTKLNSRLNDSERAALFKQVCSAMAHAHNRGVLHRDLAPRNVLVFPSGSEVHVRVADFGFGRDLSSNSSRGGSTNQEAGHVAYVAPEQRLDLSAATERSDVYALGRLLRFVLTGRDPDALGVCAFSHVVATATQHDPARRYANAAEVLRAFEALHSLASEVAGHVVLSSLHATSQPVDWDALHDAIVSARIVGHVYYEFLEPLTAYLGVTGRLEEYQRHSEPMFDAFVQKYLDRLKECMPLTRWPFSAMDWLGRFLFHVFEVAASDNGRKPALQGLWMLAYEHDQWAVQRSVQTLLSQHNLSPELDEALAAQIVTSRCLVDLSAFAITRLPALTRAALSRNSDS